MDWERGRIRIQSPKTEHHEGGEPRLVPLFPELLPYLREVFEQAEPGTEYVITRCRHRNCNLRTQLQRIIRQADLNPWPKLIQNLHSTRETELAERWPEHVVCAWIGNSKAVARKHYLQVTDEHFERAVQESDRHGGAAQNAAQQMHAEPRIASHPIRESAKFDVRRDPARHCESLVGRVGHEHPPPALSRSPISEGGGAKSDARDAPDTPQDPDLALIQNRWPGLPEHIKAAIMALVRGHKEGGR